MVPTQFYILIPELARLGRRRWRQYEMPPFAGQPLLCSCAWQTVLLAM